MIENYIKLVQSVNEKYGYFSDNDNSFISLNKNLTNYTFTVGNSVIISLKFGKTYQRLLIKKQLFNKVDIDLKLKVPYDLKSEPLYKVVDFLPEDDVTNYIRPFLEYSIENYTPPKTFGCCHLYKECSNAKKCLHPQQVYAKQCWYRDNLENGNIFYAGE